MRKLKKSELPLGHDFKDFECFGPAATKDGIFDNTKIADFGCFDQSGESKNNKYYHACVCKSRINSLWYCFYNWGKVGNSKSDFQFVECSSEIEAQKVYEKQCHSKNDKRGEWYDHPQLGKILRAKKNKDCYLVRAMATRVSLLPDVSKITTKPTQVITGNSSNLDQETLKLLSDLSVGTNTYSKSQFASGLIPDISSINEARNILGLISKSINGERDELIKILYSKIPKKTRHNEVVSLSTDDIKNWYDDLDAFESAYEGIESGGEINTHYPLRHIDKTSQLHYNLCRLIEQSTRNRHSYLKNSIKIKNIWEITEIPKWFTEQQESVAKEYNGQGYPLIFQPKRTELEVSCNCQLLFHGSRSVNIQKILTSGFKLPKELSGVQINGWVNGPACYHANDYKKSIGYRSIPGSFWSKGSGTIKGRDAFMFLNDVILGNPYIISYPRNEDSPPNGYHSVVADTNGSFQNEEFMSYDKKMFYPRYLIEFNV